MILEPAAPLRRQILTLVRDREVSAGQIAAEFDVSWPAVSQHLTVLKEAGLVSERRNGTRRLYRARPEGLAELKAFLETFWDERLDTLKREAERAERRSVHTATDTILVEREIAIDASPETVWEFLVDPAKATRWMGTSASFDLRRGGEYRVDDIPGNVARGEFVEIDPPRRLVFTRVWEEGRAPSVPARRGSSSSWCPTATAPFCASATPGSRARRRPARTRTGGITTSRGWGRRRPAATQAPTRGSAAR